MGRYIEIDGQNYYSPCSNCKDKWCYSCVINKYKEDYLSEKDRRSSAEWQIEKELEPRIKAEKDSYDRWVSTDTGAEACECFLSLLDKLIDFVEDNDKYMEWDSCSGDLEEMILYLIRNKDNVEHLCIQDNWDLG